MKEKVVMRNSKDVIKDLDTPFTNYYVRHWKFG